MRVLVVEDYEPLRSSVEQGLREAGFAVDSTSDGEEGLWYAQSHGYDVIVLDIMLPSLDGLSILSRLRRDGNKTPVLLLTARDTVEDRVGGLNAGADDYLIKPFAFEEFLARVRALARRRYDNPDPVLRVLDLEINTATQSVHRGEKAVKLTGKQYALLEFLAMRAGRVVSRTEIWEHIYEFHSEAESNVVDVYIGYLRKKLACTELPELIHTRRGRGYVLGKAD